MTCKTSLYYESCISCFLYSLDPLIVHKPLSGTRQAFIKFSHNSDVILVGDYKGEVSVFITKNTPPYPANKVKPVT